MQLRQDIQLLRQPREFPGRGGSPDSLMTAGVERAGSALALLTMVAIVAAGSQAEAGR